MKVGDKVYYYMWNDAVKGEIVATKTTTAFMWWGKETICLVKIGSKFKEISEDELYLASA